MAQYAIAFDVDTKGMRDDGFTNSQITNLYQSEIPTALASVVRIRLIALHVRSF